MEPVRIGIIGCGVISKSHLELAAKSSVAKVVAVADIIEERAVGRAQEFGIAKHYDGDESLLRDDNVEAVVLAMPAGVRSTVAVKALKRGKHVLLEKPVARSVKEVKRLMDLRGDLVVGCCSSRYTFTGHARVAAECYATGALGQVRMASIRALRPAFAPPQAPPPTWRQSMDENGGGILVNWSCYELNYILHIMDWQLKPREVLAHWWPTAPRMSAYVAPGSDADAHYTALIRCEDGIVLNMQRAEFCTTPVDQAWQIVGSDASLAMPMVRQDEKTDAVVLHKFVESTGIVSRNLWEAAQGSEDQGNVLDDFASAIRSGGRPRTDLERALVLQKVTDAIYKSAKSGKSVSIT